MVRHYTGLGRDHKSGEADWEQYTVTAPDAETAKKRARKEAESGLNSIIDTQTEGTEIVEVSGPHA